MPEFEMPFAGNQDVDTFCELDEFTQGYVEAIYWTECNADCEEGMEDLTMEDMAAETLSDIKEDCASFQRDNAADLEGIDSHQSGVDFWLTRNRHGAGFWEPWLG